MGKVLKQLARDMERERKAKVAKSLAPEALITLLRKQRQTTSDLQAKSGGTEREVMDAIHAIQGRGFLLSQFGEHWGMSAAPEQHTSQDVYKSRKDGTYLFGFSSDQHLCSKYERLDVLNGLYDHFAEQGVDRVFNGGNWIDGEARFNLHDLKVHGMDQQCWYLAEHFPQRPGITTYAVAGDDHEGWYGQREGIDIGKHAERIMRQAGRKDWVHLGFMEAFTDLVHAKSGAAAKWLTMHPGGGSAYAMSYKPQKIVESFAGGEKPAGLLVAHYHKLSFNIIRNVFAVQSGTTQDQTPFMRKKGIDAHVGGGICKITQDAESGALTQCRVEFFQYFNQGFYNNRWSHGGDVVLPERGA